MLTAQIREAFDANRRVYGSPRIHTELAGEGVHVGRKRIARLVRAADMTYVPTVQGWLFLACVTDLSSRRVLGWSMASHRTTDLVVDAVAMAVGRRGGHVPGVIHHCDRGGEYTSHAPSGNSAGATRSRAWDRWRTATTTRWPRACSTSSSAAGSRPAAGQARRVRLPRGVLQPASPALRHRPGLTHPLRGGAHCRNRCA